MRTIFIAGLAAALHFATPAYAAATGGMAAATPDSGTWVLLLGGFALIGLGLRGRERQVDRVTN